MGQDNIEFIIFHQTAAAGGLTAFDGVELVIQCNKIEYAGTGVFSAASFSPLPLSVTDYPYNGKLMYSAGFT